MRVLKCLSGFEMRFDIQYRFVCESFAFEAFVSRNVISVYGISAVNFMFWWCLFAVLMNWMTWCLCTFRIENISSIYLFQTGGLRAPRLRVSVSTTAIKIFAKATAILVLMAVPCV